VTVSRSAYVFVPARQFAGVNVSSVRVPVTQNATFIARARPATQFAVQGGVLSSGGPTIPQVERVAGKRIQRVSIASAKTQPVPIRTSLQGGRSRAAVVVPASEREKLLVPREKRGPQQVSRSKTTAVTTDRAVRSLPPPSAKQEKHEKATANQPPPRAHEKHEKATVHQPPPPAREKDGKATVQQPPPPPPAREKQEKAVVRQPPPPSSPRPEKAGTQAQLSSRQPHPAHVEKQHSVEAKSQGPPTTHANPPGKEKDKEHGKEN
jgi:hypothetical protein